MECNDNTGWWKVFTIPFCASTSEMKNQDKFNPLFNLMENGISEVFHAHLSVFPLFPVFF